MISCRRIRSVPAARLNPHPLQPCLSRIDFIPPCLLFTLLPPALQPSPLSPLLPPLLPHPVPMPMSTLPRCKMLKLDLHPSAHLPRLKQSLLPLQSANALIGQAIQHPRRANRSERLETVQRKRKRTVLAFIARKRILLVMTVLFFSHEQQIRRLLPVSARPCQRCLKRGIGDNCTEGHRKKAKYLLDDDELGMSPLSLHCVGSIFLITCIRRGSQTK